MAFRSFKSPWNESKEEQKIRKTFVDLAIKFHYRLKSLSYLRLPFDGHFSRFKFPALRIDRTMSTEMENSSRKCKSWNDASRINGFNLLDGSSPSNYLHRVALLKLNHASAYISSLPDLRLFISSQNSSHYTKWNACKYLFRSRKFQLELTLTHLFNHYMYQKYFNRW